MPYKGKTLKNKGSAFEIDEYNKTVSIYDYNHHDNIYK